MFDPLNEWCYTPEDRRIRHNRQVVKQFLREKVAKYTVWRETNKIKTGDVITLADTYRMHFDDEEV